MVQKSILTCHIRSTSNHMSSVVTIPDYNSLIFHSIARGMLNKIPSTKEQGRNVYPKYGHRDTVGSCPMTNTC